MAASETHWSTGCKERNVKRQHKGLARCDLRTKELQLLRKNLVVRIVDRQATDFTDVRAVVAD